MADTKISALSAAAAGAIELPAVQGAGNVKMKHNSAAGAPTVSKPRSSPATRC